MKLLEIICVGVIILEIAIGNSEFDQQWEHFKIKFKKNYQRSEEIVRKHIWMENINFIFKHNINYDLGLYSYKLSINEYADMIEKEFKNKMIIVNMTLNESSEPAYNFEPLSDVLPASVDWRKKGYVTAVKNMGSCPAPWAFSAAGALEGQHKRKTGKLVSLSVQNLIDCSKAEGNAGCEGGTINRAFEYVIRNRGVDTEKAYPYEGKEGPCRFERKSVGATCRGYVNLPNGDEEALKQAIANIGPISAVIDASSENFQLYSAGVYNNPNCSSKELNLPILVVGYGTDNGLDYWLVKNNWGINWGIEGYIKMARNKQNQCGIASAASYPIS